MSGQLQLIHALMNLKGEDDIEFLAKVFIGLAARAEEKGSVAANVLREIGERCEAMGLEAGGFRHALMTAYVGGLMAELGVKEAADEIEGLARFIRDQYVPKGEVN